MLILKFSKKDSQVTSIEERFRQMSLAFKLEQVDGLEQMTLQEGKVEVVGFEAINAHLNQLASELKDWYYCYC